MQNNSSSHAAGTFNPSASTVCMPAHLRCGISLQGNFPTWPPKQTPPAPPLYFSALRCAVLSLLLLQLPAKVTESCISLLGKVDNIGLTLVDVLSTFLESAGTSGVMARQAGPGDAGCQAHRLVCH